MPPGTVNWFNAQKGYGFTQPNHGSKDACVHLTAVERAGLSGFNAGRNISYEGHIRSLPEGLLMAVA
jgi:CspA family cold shock protein